MPVLSSLGKKKENFSVCSLLLFQLKKNCLQLKHQLVLYLCHSLVSSWVDNFLLPLHLSWERFQYLCSSFLEARLSMWCRWSGPAFLPVYTWFLCYQSPVPTAPHSKLPKQIFYHLCAQCHLKAHKNCAVHTEVLQLSYIKENTNH